MKDIVFTGRFERDFKSLKRKLPAQVLDYATLAYVFGLLQAGKPLPSSFNEHPLQGEFSGFMECHLDADWLLIYRVFRDRVVMHRTGTHRDLFRQRVSHK